MEKIWLRKPQPSLTQTVGVNNMKTIIKLLTLILLLMGCQNRALDKKLVETDFQTIGFELNQSLIDEFHRDDRLRPDNPEFEF